MSDGHRLPERDRPWVMRTYAGHSTAKESNALYRRNLEKGQTGLSIAFDLPTQTGYDPDHELSRGEVGKVGVSIAHKGDMHTLLDGIPLGEMNTSMTINATAAWLLALYMTVAEENGHLVMRFLPSPNFVADLEHWHYDTFQIKWRPSVAYNFPRGFVTFTIDKNGKTDRLIVDQPNNDFWFYELDLRRKSSTK